MEPMLILLYASVYIGLVATTFYILGFLEDKKKIKQLYSDQELPRVSVIIPMWNEEKSIARTIESMYASDYPQNKYEIIVVDNNSKDKSLEIVKNLKNEYLDLKIFMEKRQGKGCALNRGIKEATGEIIFTMDADSFVNPNCIKEMARYFKNPNVMSVSPSMLVYKPKGILQRIQQAEYQFGLFLRKAFTSINAIYVTPGAFSAYRKSFFDKHGLYDEGNITEDLEIAMRIQSHNYLIEYSPESAVYTIAPRKFKPLLTQRKRWYVGLMRNTWKYRRLVSKKYGDMGTFVLPIAWISILFSVIVVNYSLVKMVINLKREIVFLNSINFNLSGVYSINSHTLEMILLNLLTNPIFIFLIIFIFVLGGFMKYSTGKTGKVKGFYLSILLYFLFFSIMFGFWWTVSIVYTLFNKKVKWR